MSITTIKFMKFFCVIINVGCYGHFKVVYILLGHPVNVKPNSECKGEQKASYIKYRCITAFPADPEELCAGEGSNQGSLAGGAHNALLQRAQAAEERARLSEEALARAMDDLHKLRSASSSSSASPASLSLVVVGLHYLSLASRRPQ